jgi:hypothetical protein
VSILKSLVDWEQARRGSSNQGTVVEYHEYDASARSLTTDETKVQDDGRNQFERAKAHKSTMEAAISEVGGLLFLLFHFATKRLPLLHDAPQIHVYICGN